MALVNGAKRLGAKVTKAQVHAAILPTQGDTEVGVIVDYALKSLEISMCNARDPATLGYSLFQAKGGPEHALLQLTTGVYFVELVVSQTGKPDDRHALVYDAGYTVPEGRAPEHYTPLVEAGYTPATFGQIRGIVLDNDKDTPAKFLEPSDREIEECNGIKVYKARLVFDSLFPFASSVRVVGAWLMQCM